MIQLCLTKSSVGLQRLAIGAAKSGKGILKNSSKVIPKDTPERPSPHNIGSSLDKGIFHDTLCWALLSVLSNQVGAGEGQVLLYCVRVHSPYFPTCFDGTWLLIPLGQKARDLKMLILQILSGGARLQVQCGGVRISEYFRKCCEAVLPRRLEVADDSSATQVAQTPQLYEIFLAILSKRHNFSQACYHHHSITQKLGKLKSFTTIVVLHPRPWAHYVDCGVFIIYLHFSNTYTEQMSSVLVGVDQLLI